jgi:hypothetical protein
MGLTGLAVAMLNAPARLLPKAAKKGLLVSGPCIRPAEPLDLRPGQIVQVKSLDEILATLDSDRRHNGLLWMNGMSRYCGTRQRVYKQVRWIVLEHTGQLRRVKGTVLLEGVMCDGSDFGGCDRSCLFFWKEAWLRPIAKE